MSHAVALEAVLLAAASLASPPPPAAASAGQGAPAVRCAEGAADACREVGRALVVSAQADRIRLGAAHVTLACDLGDAPSCGDLGALHALGRGVVYDAERAIALSRRACDAGVGLACSNLAVLLVEEAGGLAPSAGLGAGPGRPATEAVRRFRIACDSGAAEGCVDLAAALEAGVGAGSRRDREGAVAALRRACDLGLAIGCHRLALLTAATGPAAVACRAAIAPACEVAGLPVPAPGAATPSPRLVSDPGALVLGLPGAGGFHPADLAARETPSPSGPEALAPSAAVAASVPAALRPRLALDGPTTPAPPDAAVSLLLPARKVELGQCLEVPRSAPRERVRLAVAFAVEPDGRTSGVRTASLPAEPEVEACAAALAGAWEFPIAGRTLGPFAVAYELEPLPGGEAPGYAGPEDLRPAPRDPGCLARALPVGGPVRTVSLKLAVDAGGRASLVHPLSLAPEALLAAAAEAVRACPWSPGTGAGGRPTLLWTTVTVPIGSR